MLIATAGCEIESDHYHRGGYYHGYRGEYPNRYYGHSEGYRVYHPYDRDRYYYRDRD
jgi:hypothetical protein